MDRTEIEVKLNRDRAWLLETVAALQPEDLIRGATPSEHDPSEMWSPLDHLVHLAGIERNFSAMIGRHVDGNADPVGLLRNSDGSSRTREEVMAAVHRMNEDYIRQHRGKSLAEVVALGQEARAETLALLAGLLDAQLREKVPGAPWGDGTIGTLLALHADHGRMHWHWVKEGFAQAAQP
ncbi:MAG: DinB family protein [Dehalococcoidia bacterium]